MTIPRRESMSGISNEIIWCSALIPPINGHLLFADHDESTVIIGKNPIVAKTANNPTLGFAATHPGATGISDVNAAAVPTKSNGANQKIGLSAFAGIIISFDISF